MGAAAAAIPLAFIRACGKRPNDRGTSLRDLKKVRATGLKADIKLQVAA